MHVAQYITQKNGLQAVTFMLEVCAENPPKVTALKHSLLLYFRISDVSVLKALFKNDLPSLIYAGKTGLLLWAITLAGILLGGALLVYNTSALAS